MLTHDLTEAVNETKNYRPTASTGLCIHLFSVSHAPLMSRARSPSLSSVVVVAHQVGAPKLDRIHHDFEQNIDVVLGSFWGHLGSRLAPLLSPHERPHRVKFGAKRNSNAHSFCTCGLSQITSLSQTKPILRWDGHWDRQSPMLVRDGSNMVFAAFFSLWHFVFEVVPFWIRLDPKDGYKIDHNISHKKLSKLTPRRPRVHPKTSPSRTPDAFNTR